jgi:hypothetical protein
MGFAVRHFPLVKSGKSTGAPLDATDCSLSGIIALQVVASYTSMGVCVLLRTAFTNSCNVM